MIERSPIVLMYHGIISGAEDVPQGREPGAGRYDLPHGNFRDHLSFLHNSGRRVLLFPEAGKSRESVVITFDDGERNNFSRAFPELERLHLPAYFFVTVSRVGTPGYMGWEELSRMAQGGMVIGSHSLTHRIMTGLNDGELLDELDRSRKILEDRLGLSVRDFSVPRGFYDDRLIGSAMAAGYERIFASTRNDVNDPVIPRVAVQAPWTVGRLQLALRGRVPLSEWCFDMAKGVAKRVLGGEGYDHLRGTLVR